MAGYLRKLSYEYLCTSPFGADFQNKSLLNLGKGENLNLVVRNDELARGASLARKFVYA